MQAEKFLKFRYGVSEFGPKILQQSVDFFYAARLRGEESRHEIVNDIFRP
jgi:hypothetical protein